MLFKKCENVMLKVSLLKGVRNLKKKGKLSQGFIKPFEVLNVVDLVAYKFYLPPFMFRVHPVYMC